MNARVEIDFGSGWVDVSSDVVSDIKADWGIHGSTPKDRCADPGTMTFDLDNSAGNAGGVVGYYSPGGPDARAGFGIGAAVRLVLNHPLYGDKVKWVGTVNDVKPSPGVENPIASVIAVDWMEEAALSHMSGIPVQVDIQSDALFPFLVGIIARTPPGGTRIGTGSDVYPYALDNVQDESSTVLGELQKLALSEYGQIYVTAGVAVFEGRLTRGTGGTIRFALDEDTNLLEVGVSHSRDDISNRIQVSIHPRRRDASPNAILFNLGSAMPVARGASVQVNCPYRDPNQQAQRVGGVDMVDPIAPTTQYLFNSAQDGSGTDLTAQITVVFVDEAGTPISGPDVGGNSAAVKITNPGPADGFLTFLQLVGRGLYDFEPVISDLQDAASLAAFGQTILSYDMPYQSSPTNASDLAIFLLNLNKGEATRVLTATFLANWGDAETEAAFNLEVSDRVSVVAASIGLVATAFYVNGFTYEIQSSGLVKITMDLAPVDRSQFWQLDVAGRTELDETTILGYGLFATGWVLGTSILGTDTSLSA